MPQCDPAVNIMRDIFVLILCLSTIHAWNLHISPNGDRLMNRKAGDNFMIVCKVQDFDGPANDVKVEWYQGDAMIKTGRILSLGSAFTNQLLISKARKEDSGEYTCKAEVNGATQEATANINFIRAPEFVDAQSEQHPEEGHTAEIVCKVEGEPAMEIFWQFNGNTLNEVSPRGYDFKDNNQVLVIPDYDSKKDDGLYLCNAAQYSSFETLTINVSGYSSPVITVFEGPANNRSFEGHSAQFKCQAIGKPKPTYKWFKVEDNEEITSSDLYGVEDGLLVIHKVTGTDSGNYKCEAQNYIGKHERTVELSVFLRPKVEKIANQTIQENESVEFECKYSGEGAVKAKFVFGNQEYAVLDESEKDVETTETDLTKNDEVDEGDESFAREHVELENMEDDDEYEQNEKNEKEKDQDENEKDDVTENSHVSIVNEIHKSEELEHLDKHVLDHHDKHHEKDESNEDVEDYGVDEPENENDDSEIRNESDTEDDVHEDYVDDKNKDDASVEENEEDEEAEENEKALRWRRDVSSGRVAVRADNNRLILKIKDLQQADAGTYQCVVENEAGEIVRTANLAITHSPVMKSWTESKIRSFDGHEIELTCHVKAVPAPSWSWILDGTKIEADGTSVRIDSHGEHSTLRLRTSEGKYGIYTCNADNGVGEPAEKNIEVIEVFPPATPKQLNCHEHVYPNYGSCTFGIGEYDQDNTKPTEVQFFYAMATEVNDDFDWQSRSKSIKVPFSNIMRITGLSTNTGYVVRARVSNEAGTSEIGAAGAIETTDPWAPEKPDSVTVECDDVCVVSWVEPNNHGSDISGYRITVREYVQDENSDEKNYNGNALEITVGASDEAVELTQLKPTARYEVAVSALNVIGYSDPRVTAFETPASLSPLMADGLSSTQLIIVVFGVLALLCVIIDLICFATNRCGLMACICLNCFGRNPDRKQKDVEGGNRSESNRLLDGATR